MQKLMAAALLSLVGHGAGAGVVYLDNVTINEVSSYDDWEGGIVLVGTSSKLSSCSAGQYLNPQSPGFERLYSLALVGATSREPVRLQLYDDRKIGDRCEIDAIRIFFR
jgi:hypothetical protein